MASKPSTTQRFSDYVRFVIFTGGRYDDIQNFLACVSEEALQLSEIRAVAFVRPIAPEWEVVATAGVAASHVPAELAAAAVDEERTVQEDDWLARQLGGQCCVLLRGEVAPVEFEQLCEALSQALECVTVQQQRSRRIRRLEKILEITHTWSQTNCMEALLKAMAEAATELLDADRASIFLWDRANKTLVGRPALGVEGDELRIPEDTGIVGQVVQSGQPRRVGGAYDSDQIARKVDKSTGYHTETLLCVPLNTPGGRRLGAFEVLNKHEGRFTDEDEQGLMELAGHAAVALENTQQLEELLSKHQRLIEEAAEGIQLVGESAVIEAVRSTTRRIADTDLAILILGENGTGKEVVARSIHYLSRRREQPFIAVNCAALSETLLESELFGHEKGAFTDAHETRAGKFELASGGTLFLDEIGDMSLSGQAKLLRVLEEKTVVRVGGSKPVHTEVRILAATNQDLGKMVREKRFREDLFFRLNVVSIKLPPLRERSDDIVRLAEHFLETFCLNMGRRTPKLSAASKKQLLAHPWPGNVRELRNLMERIAYLSTGDRVEVEDLAFIDGASDHKLPAISPGASLADATNIFQAQYIQQLIDEAKGNMSKAAQRLGLHRSNLYRKMRQLEMNVSSDGEK